MNDLNLSVNLSDIDVSAEGVAELGRVAVHVRAIVSLCAADKPADAKLKNDRC